MNNLDRDVRGQVNVTINNSEPHNHGFSMEKAVVGLNGDRQKNGHQHSPINNQQNGEHLPFNHQHRHFHHSAPYGHPGGGHLLHPGLLTAACCGDAITSLNLSHASLKNLPLEVTKLKNLRQLNLAHNQLSVIPIDGFYASFSRLQSLNLAFNRIAINKDDSIVFQQLAKCFPSLMHLNLAYNRPDPLSPSSVSSTSVRTLNLSSLTFLVHLNLAGCGLSNPGSNEPLELIVGHRLEKLILHSNHLTIFPVIKPSAICGTSTPNLVTAIKVLDLSNNHIQYSSGTKNELHSLLRSVPLLRHFDVSSNQPMNAQKNSSQTNGQMMISNSQDKRIVMDNDESHNFDRYLINCEPLEAKSIDLVNVSSVNKLLDTCFMNTFADDSKGTISLMMIHDTNDDDYEDGDQFQSNLYEWPPEILITLISGPNYVHIIKARIEQILRREYRSHETSLACLQSAIKAAIHYAIKANCYESDPHLHDSDLNVILCQVLLSPPPTEDGSPSSDTHNEDEGQAERRRAAIIRMASYGRNVTVNLLKSNKPHLECDQMNLIQLVPPAKDENHLDACEGAELMTCELDLEEDDMLLMEITHDGFSLSDELLNEESDKRPDQQGIKLERLIYHQMKRLTESMIASQSVDFAEHNLLNVAIRPTSRKSSDPMPGQSVCNPKPNPKGANLETKMGKLSVSSSSNSSSPLSIATSITNGSFAPSASPMTIKSDGSEKFKCWEYVTEEMNQRLLLRDGKPIHNDEHLIEGEPVLKSYKIQNKEGLPFYRTAAIQGSNHNGFLRAPLSVQGLQRQNPLFNLNFKN